MISVLLPLLLSAANGASPPGLYAVYAQNRAEHKPNYVTEDFLLVTYGMLLEDAITHMEEKIAAPEMRAILAELAKALESGGSPEIRAFVDVTAALLEGWEQSGFPHANDELRLVAAAAGIARSPLSGQTVDYSQFKPRGKYANSPEFSRYFRAMRYAGAVLFPVQATRATNTQPADARRLTTQAIALAKAIRSAPSLEQRYQALLDKLTWAFGKSEDLTIEDLLEAPASEPEKFLLERARKTGRQPKILGGVVDVGKLEPGVTAADALTGWRLFPSRYTPDSAAIQALVFDKVTRYKGSGKPFTGTTVNGRMVKGFPRAAELMAILGSKTAARQVSNDINYEGYPAARETAGRLLSGGDGLAALHFQLMEFWLKGAPTSERRLNTALALFTMHRHANVLYAKQSYTPVAKSFNPADDRPGAWIEPQPVLFTMLRRLTAQAATQLGYAPLNEFAAVLDRCIDIAFDAAAGRALNEEQVRQLNGLDVELKRLTNRDDAPIAVDIHTDANSGQVVEEAIAHPSIVEAKGARGALFRHREFKQPMEKRLTDEEWKEMLARETK